MIQPPLPQQEVMTNYTLEHEECGIFAHPGTGKTKAILDAITFLLSDLAIKGVLIVAPLRVATLTWPNEIELWAPHLSVANLRTPEGLKAWDEGAAEVFTINYDMLDKFVDRCLKKRKRIPVDMVVWDEISKAKSHTSKRIKAFLPYRKMFSRHVGLTGTPQPNSALDLFAQIRLLDGGVRLGTSYTNFRDRYATGDFMGWSYELNEGSEEAIRDKIKDMCLVIRREDWAGAVDITYEDIDIALPPAVMKDYKKMEKDFLVEIARKEVVALTAATLVQKLLQFTSGASYFIDDTGNRDVVKIHDAKTSALLKLHESLGRKPLLVFTQFKHEVPRIMEAMPWAQEFDENRMQEWNDGKIPLWICHPKSMAHGLSLQGTCHHVCWFSLTYSNEDFIQGNARIARTGQKNPVTVYRLLANKTVDWAVSETLRRKETSQSALMETLRFVRKVAEAS